MEPENNEQESAAPEKDNVPLIVAIIALIAIGVGAFIYSRFSSRGREPVVRQPAMPTTAEMFSQPTGVLVLQYGALLVNEPSTLLDCYQIDSPVEQDLADAYVAMAQGIATLRNATEKHFGSGSFREMGIERNLQVEMQRIPQAKTTVEGNTAKIYAFGEKVAPLVVLRQPDQRW